MLVDIVITVLLLSDPWHALNMQWIILQEQFVKSQVDIFDHLNLLNQVHLWCWKYSGLLTQTGQMDILYHRTLRMQTGWIWLGVADHYSGAGWALARDWWAILLSIVFSWALFLSFFVISLFFSIIISISLLFLFSFLVHYYYFYCS